MEDLISTAKTSLVKSKDRLIKTLSFVPDEKLTWSPSPSSRSALQVAAHVAIATSGIAGALSGGEMPKVSKEEFFGMMKQMEADISTRDLAIAKLEESVGFALATLDKLTPEQLSGIAETPFGPMPVSLLASILGPHAEGHASQIDYIQTIWGDLQDHF
jgi:hypothetical protein